MARALVKNASIGNPRNILINGAMDFFQRTGGAAVSSGTGGYTIGGSSSYFSGGDRWLVRPGGSATATISRSTDVPETRMNYSLKYLDAAVAGGKSAQIMQRIESTNIAPLIGKLVTFSAWVKVDVASAGTLSFDIGTPSLGLDSWSSDPNVYTGVSSSGSLSYTLGSWKRHSYSFVVPTTAVNGLVVNVLANTYTSNMALYVTGAMLTEGPVAPVTFYRAGDSLQEELAMCQRYYEKSYLLGAAAGTVDSNGLAFFRAQSATNANASMTYKTTKRIQPTLTFFSRNGTVGTFTSDTTTSDVAVTITSNVNSDTEAQHYSTAIVSGVAGTFYRAHWTANAEL